MKIKKRKIGILLELILLGCLVILYGIKSNNKEVVQTIGEGEIKWVDFNVSYDALCQAYELDVSTYDESVHLNWIELLAYVATKNGGDFSHSVQKEMDKIANQLIQKETTMKEATKDLKYYSYYSKAYEAVLGGYVGEYEIQQKQEDGSIKLVQKYGLKAFSPIAKGFEYSDYDDFGSSRSYGYKREHLGHDMMGQIGTPIWI